MLLCLSGSKDPLLRIPLQVSQVLQMAMRPVVPSRLLLILALAVCGCDEATSVRGTADGPTRQTPANRESEGGPSDTPGIPFLTSLREAANEANRQGKRVLVYFTGPNCGWCEMMERETFPDAGVRELASRFVCVKVDIAQEPLAQERYRAYSIPRTLIVNEEMQPVALRIGYQEVEPFSAFLREAATQPTMTWEALFAKAADEPADGNSQSAHEAPPAVGAAPDNADVTLWFVEQDAERFSDPEWAAHAKLLRVLGDCGIAPRIEHVWRWDLTARWEQVTEEGRRPEFLVTRSRGGLVRELLAGDQLIDVISERLLGALPLAVCDDFATRSILVVRGSRRLEQTEKAIECLMVPARGVSVGSEPKLSAEEAQVVGSLVADAAVSWHTGDIEALRPHWHERALQKGITDESTEMQGRRTYVDMRVPEVRLFGNDRIVFALAEIRGRGHFDERPWFVASEQILGSPVLVVLQRDGDDDEWKILAIGILQYDLVVDDVAKLYAFEWAAGSDAGDPPQATIAAPADGAVISDAGVSIKWASAEATEGPLLRLLVRSWESHPGLPRVSFTVLSENGDSGEVGPVSVRVTTRATIWSINPSGRVTFSPVVTWHAADAEE